MNAVIDKIVGFDDLVLRNTIGLNPHRNDFDDLSEESSDWEVAETAVDFTERFTATELQYNVIDFVFEQRNWPKSRFSDGTFATWYGSIELETTFHSPRFKGDYCYRISSDDYSKVEILDYPSERVIDILS